MAHSKPPSKPAKPRPSTRPAKRKKRDFPLFVHATGRWCKKVRGKFCYFGRVADDPQGTLALDQWLDQRDDLLAGRPPRARREGLTLAGLCNDFLAAKELAVAAGELTQRWFDDNYTTCTILLKVLGKNRLVSTLGPPDFQLLRSKFAERFGPVVLCNQIQRTRSIFKYGHDNGLIDVAVRFGSTFKRPSKRVLRLERQRKGAKMLEARELRRMLKAASVPLRAMLLLGLNAGYGNSDCATLPLAAVDLKAGWIDYARPKTGIQRRAPLWPETVQAIEAVIERRPKVNDPEARDLLFVTKRGFSWAKDTSDNPTTKECRKLLDRLGLHKPGLGFYLCRHVFQTIAGECGDQIAVGSIMGHADDSMAAAYRERITDARLLKATNTVRRWLFRRQSATPWRMGKGKQR